MCMCVCVYVYMLQTRESRSHTCVSQTHETSRQKFLFYENELDDAEGPGGESIVGATVISMLDPVLQPMIGKAQDQASKRTYTRAHDHSMPTLNVRIFFPV
jgi:hypothetical protein